MILVSNTTGVTPNTTQKYLTRGRGRVAKPGTTHARVHAHTPKCRRAHKHSYMHARLHVRTPACMHTYMHARLHAQHGYMRASKPVRSATPPPSHRAHGYMHARAHTRMHSGTMQSRCLRGKSSRQWTTMTCTGGTTYRACWLTCESQGWAR